MAENLSQSELDYPFKLLEYFNGFRVSKVTLLSVSDQDFPQGFLCPAGICFAIICSGGSLLDPSWTSKGAFV